MRGGTLLTLVFVGWLLGCVSAEDGSRNSSASIPGCAEVTRRSGGVYIPEDKGRFKCIFDRDNGAACPTEKTVYHDGDRYLCEQPKPRTSKSTQCKTWCQNIPPMEGCTEVVRGEWSRTDKVKCIFPKDASGQCEHKTLKHGDKEILCETSRPRNSDSSQCKAWCKDDNALDLVPSEPLSCDSKGKGIAEFLCAQSLKAALCTAAGGPGVGGFLCLAAAFTSKAGENLFWKKVGEVLTTSFLEDVLVSMGICRSWAAVIVSGIFSDPDGAGFICGQLTTCACNALESGSCVGRCEDNNENLKITGCTGVSRYHDGVFKQFDKDKFKCTFPASWDNVTGDFSCPTEKAVVHDGDSYLCEPPEQRNANDAGCKAWCQNISPIEGCTEVTRGEFWWKHKVQCIFPRDASGTCGEEKMLKHGSRVFTCETPETHGSSQCEAWCTDDHYLDLVPSESPRRLTEEESLLLA